MNDVQDFAERYLIANRLKYVWLSDHHLRIDGRLDVWPKRSKTMKYHFIPYNNRGECVWSDIPKLLRGSK